VPTSFNASSLSPSRDGPARVYPARLNDRLTWVVWQPFWQPLERKAATSCGWLRNGASSLICGYALGRTAAIKLLGIF
jgi:hypothetical protein